MLNSLVAETTKDLLSKNKKAKIIVKRKYTGEETIVQIFSEVLIRALLKESKELIGA